jgi:hypothetical protein
MDATQISKLYERSLERESLLIDEINKLEKVILERNKLMEENKVLKEELEYATKVCQRYSKILEEKGIHVIKLNR